MGKGMNNRESFVLGYHVVCLLDILGQKERLARWGEPSVEGGGLTAAYRQALKDTVGVVLGWQKRFETFFDQFVECKIPEQYARLDENQRELYRRYKECRLAVQQFSDTFVFYAPVTNDHGDVSVTPLYRMIGACATAMLASLALRTPVRGALTVGVGMELPERSFYGPALAEAHYLESRVAQYPRIVVSPYVDDFLNNVRGSSKGGRLDDMMRQLAMVCSSMLVTDHDGQRIVDYMGEGVSKLPAFRAASCDFVRLAYEFTCTEAERFRAEGNQKLAERYDNLRRYMQPRMEKWSDVHAE
jgi:hypothetical protein